MPPRYREYRGEKRDTYSHRHTRTDADRRFEKIRSIEQKELKQQLLR